MLKYEQGWGKSTLGMVSTNFRLSVSFFVFAVSMESNWVANPIHESEVCYRVQSYIKSFFTKLPCSTFVLFREVLIFNLRYSFPQCVTCLEIFSIVHAQLAKIWSQKLRNLLASPCWVSRLDRFFSRENEKMAARLTSVLLATVK